MTILSWNCRGLGNSSTVRHLDGLIKVHRPDCVFLYETKHSTSFVTKIFNNWGWFNCLGFDSMGQSGGLFVALRDDWKILHHLSSKNIISLHLEKENGKLFTLSFIYGHPERHLRGLVWNQLRDLSSSISGPWLCLGDFNQIASPEDRFPPLPPSAPTSAEILFKNCLDDCGLLELPSQGVKYSWCNNREGQATIWERLDKAFCNSDWLTSFPLCNVTTLPMICSDHSPILVNPFPYLGKKHKRPFRFEAMWLSHPTFHQEVSKNWRIASGGSPMFQLRKKQ